MLKKLLRKLLLRKEIRSKEGDLHFQRWGVWTRWFGVYLHFIYKADKDLHWHSHPWSFRTIILRGGYREEICNQISGQVSIFDRRPVSTAFNSYWGYDFHKLKELFGPTITLVFTGYDHNDWGYLVTEDNLTFYMDFKTYREEKRKGRWREQNN